jgi:ABC-type polysaccharide/polyol phosphate export permease
VPPQNLPFVVAPLHPVALSVPRRAVHRVVPNPRWRHALGLVVVLARKNVKIRYKRTSLGVVWAVGQPLLQAAVLTFVFTRVFAGQHVPNYGLFVLCGVMPFAAISGGIQSACTSVVENAQLVKKVMLPRLVFPFAAIGGTLTVFAASLAVLVAVSAATGQLGLHTIGLLPLAIAALLAVAVSVGVFSAALYVQYRDVKFILESGLLMLFYASPVFYDSSRLGSVAEWQRLNPVTGVLSLMRGALAGFAVDWLAVAWTFAFGGVLLAIGLVVFQRRSQLFADLT